MFEIQNSRQSSDSCFGVDFQSKPPRGPRIAPAMQCPCPPIRAKLRRRERREVLKEKGLALCRTDRRRLDRRLYKIENAIRELQNEWPDSEFLRQAAPWWNMGYAVIPCEPETKRPLVKFGYFAGQIRTIIGPSEIRRFVEEHPNADAGIVLGSGIVPLVLVDIDKMAAAPWVDAHLADTPLSTTTGRDGGGEHRFFRQATDSVPKNSCGLFGSAEAIERREGTGLDLKAGAAIAICPGARHKTGRRYQGSIPSDSLDLAWILANVPVFDHGFYETNRSENLAQRRELAALEHGASCQPAVGPQPVQEQPERPSHSAEYISSSQGGVTAGAPVQVQPERLSHPNLSPRKQKKLEILLDEPFLRWAWDHPAKVGYQCWRGAATIVVAAFGERGRPYFHELSKRDPGRYDAARTNLEYSNALRSLEVQHYGPSTYTYLSENGWPGEIPDKPASPAAVIIRGAIGVRLAEEHQRIEPHQYSSTSGTGKYMPCLSRKMRKKIRKKQMCAVFNGDMGSGKSYVAADFAKKFTRVIVIGPSQAIARQKAYQFNCKCYLDYAKGKIHVQRISVCIPSLLRIPVPEKVDHDSIVVLEEMAQILDLLEPEQKNSAVGAIISGDKATHIFYHLQGFLATAGCIVVTDANFGRRERNALVRLGVPLEKIHVVGHKSPSIFEEVIRLQGSKEQALQYVISEVAGGKNLFIACTRKKDASAAARKSLTILRPLPPWPR